MFEEVGTIEGVWDLQEECQETPKGTSRANEDETTLVAECLYNKRLTADRPSRSGQKGERKVKTLIILTSIRGYLWFYCLDW